MAAYYNEIDPFAAAWLRELIKTGAVAPGDVDARSIEDVSPDDLRSYTQCHFFAGIGVWSYALRLAGWPDDRPVWTGSCPCQPFSAAGKAGGFADERHLWPAQFHLIRERRPTVWLGEQVASKDGLGWLDLVRDDLEGEGYAVGALDTSSALTGAPHIRQRLRIVAERVAEPGGLDDPAGSRRAEARARQPSEPEGGQRRSELGCGLDGLADSEGERRHGGQDTAKQGRRAGAETSSTTDGLADTNSTGLHLVECDAGVARQAGSDDLRQAAFRNGCPIIHGYGASASHGGWRDVDWLFCRDGKWRPVEPGTFPLAHGAPARVGRLRGYGNAVDAIATAEFIAAYLEAKAITVDHGWD